MKKIKPFGRSGTSSGLPQISHHTPRSHYQLYQNDKSSYLTNLNKQLSTNIEYEEKDSSYIGNQQKKLKNILRRINEDTLRMIGSINPRHKKQQRKTTTSVLAIKDREYENNIQILQTYKVQIEKLKQKQLHMQNSTKESYEQKLAQLAEQIQTQKAIIREIQFENGRRGKAIVNKNAQTYEGELKTVQTDKYLMELKVERLRYDFQRVKEELEEINKKTEEIASKYGKAESFFKEAKMEAKQQQKQKQNQSEYLQKKIYQENYKKKNQFYHINNEYRYYRELKKLFNTKKSIEQTDEKIQEAIISNEAARIIIEKLEAKMRTMKKKQQQKEIHLNQFLQKQASTNRDKSFLKEEMFSQIPHKNEEKQDLQSNAETLLRELKGNEKKEVEKIGEEIVEEGGEEKAGLKMDDKEEG